MVGAVAGSPGTLPTNWSFSGTSGLTQTIVGTGTENGLSYLDLRLNGTASASSVRFSTDTNTAIAALPAQIWSNSSYFKLTAGVLPYITLRNVYRNSAGGAISTPNQQFDLTSTLTRRVFTDVGAPALTAFVQQEVLAILVIGQTYDFTIRIAAPQMELGAYATTFIPTTTAAVTRLADRFSRGDLFTNGLVSAAGGTLILDLRIPFPLRDNGNENISLSDATAQNQLFLYGGSSGNTYVFGKFLSGTFSNIYISAANPANNIKIAIKWNGTSADLFQNGVKVVSATAFTATTSLQFLRSSTSGVGSIVKINQSALFPTPLTDAQCIQLTT
jgi:hypothetical protein